MDTYHPQPGATQPLLKGNPDFPHGPSASPGLPRAGALLTGGSLVAASAALFSNSPGLPHPWQQAAIAALTLLLGGSVSLLGIWWDRANASRRFLVLAAVTLAVVVLPLVRYVPPLFTFAYEQDLESFFPPLWPYSFSFPLLLALLGEMAFPAREGAAQGLWLPGAAIAAAAAIVLFGSMVVSRMTIAFLATPQLMLLATAVLLGVSALPVAGVVMARKGWARTAVALLFGIGLLLELEATRFYGGIPQTLVGTNNPLPLSPWIPFFAGNIPGALALLLGLTILKRRYFPSPQTQQAPTQPPTQAVAP